MNQQLEARADALCRDVGTATILAGVLPGLGALTGLVVMPLMEPTKAVEWGVALGFLGLAVGLAGLGQALRKRRAWSFRAAQVVFACVALGGLVALVMNDETEKVAVVIAVALPMAFVAGATKAKAADDEAKAARLPPHLQP